MQNLDTAALALDLEFFQSGLGLALLLLTALLALVCVLLTVLVVSSGANHRILLGQLESANKLLVHIHETLTSNQNPAPVRRPVTLNEPKFPPPPKAEPEVATANVTPVEPRRPAAQTARVQPAVAASTERSQAARPGKRPARGAPVDHTDVYVSTDAAQQNVLPPRGRKDTHTDLIKKAEETRRAQSERRGRAGDSTDIFTSVDV